MRRFLIGALVILLFSSGIIFFLSNREFSAVSENTKTSLLDETLFGYCRKWDTESQKKKFEYVELDLDSFQEAVGICSAGDKNFFVIVDDLDGETKPLMLSNGEIVNRSRFFDDFVVEDTNRDGKQDIVVINRGWSMDGYTVTGHVFFHPFLNPDYSLSVSFSPIKGCGSVISESLAHDSFLLTRTYLEKTVAKEVSGFNLTQCGTQNPATVSGDSFEVNKPEIYFLSLNSGPVGTHLEIFGRGFSGFEGDLNAWIENDRGVRGILYGTRGKSTSSYIVTTLADSLCSMDTSYSGKECTEWLDLVPGKYKIFVNPWGRESNKVDFEVVAI